MIRKICFLIIWIFLKDVSSNTHTGQRFVISFLRNINLTNEDAYILMTSEHDLVDVIVNLRSLDNSLIKEYGTVIKGVSRQMSMKTYFQSSYIVRKPTFEVNASMDISVTVFIIGNSTRASYLALPEHVLDSEYRAVTFCKSGHCACSITTSMVHSLVTISFTQRHRNLHLFKGEKEIPIKERNMFFLDTKEIEFEQFYFEASSDLSGTLIKSNNPFSLVCGKVTKTNIWSLEQILPISKLGKSSLPYPKMPRIQSAIKIVAPYNCTKIRIGKKAIFMDAGHVRVFSWKYIAQNKIISSAPILVAQSFNLESHFRLQESMIIVPAETHYLSKYSFPQNLDNKFTLYVAISVSMKFKIKVRGVYNGTAEAKGQVLFKHNDSNGYNVDVDTELPISKPFLVYAFRKDKKITRQYDYDIMTSPVGFNFSTEIVVPRKIRQRHRCTSNRHPTIKPTTLRSTATLPNDEHTRLSVITTDLPSLSSESIENTTSNECGYGSQKYTFNTGELRTINISVYLEKKLQSIRKVLTIDKSNLSSTKRRKMSASDNRKSARGIGFVGLTILCIVIGLIILMDLPLLLSHVTILCRSTFGIAIELARRRANCQKGKATLT